MDKKLINKFAKKLESEKGKLIKRLSSFARKDPKIKGNWRTRVPFLNRFGTFSPAEDAEKREAYENLLPVEHALEVRLQAVNDALQKIKKGAYGKCEKCGKRIEARRLKAVPEARTCLTCGRQAPRR